MRTPIGDLEVLDHVRQATEGKDLVLLGVRPEHFEDAKLVDDAVRPHGTTFTAEVSQTEWLGNEQYGYIRYESDDRVQKLLDDLAKDLDGDEMEPVVVTSFDTSSRIRGGEEAEIWVDGRKMHIFDMETGENLTRDEEAGAELTRQANEERAREIERARAKGA